MGRFDLSRRLVIVGLVATTVLSGCSGNNVQSPSGVDLNSPEEQKKVEQHYKDMAESGRGPNTETAAPGGKL